MGFLGIVIIIVFIIMLCAEKYKQHASEKEYNNAQNVLEELEQEGDNENKQRQLQLFYQYVSQCRCLTEEDINKAKEKTKELCKTISDPLMIEALTINDNDPYEHPNPFILEEVRRYASMTGYERYLLAREKLESEGYKWNDKFNRYVPDGSPDELYKCYMWVRNRKSYYENGRNYTSRNDYDLTEEERVTIQKVEDYINSK